DLFTALQRGAQTPPQLAATLGVGAGRLRLLLYALVAAGLLTEQNGHFANTPEAQHFLVQGTPTSLGALHRNLAAQWAFKLHTADSIRTGVPQAHLDWLLLDSRVVDVTRSYNPIFITISSLKPFLFNDLINEWRFVDRMEA